MTAVVAEEVLELLRSNRLKVATHAAHDGLGKALMAGDPFSSRERYGLFLQVEHGIQRDIDALYGDAGLDALLPDPSGCFKRRCRADSVSAFISG